MKLLFFRNTTELQILTLEEVAIWDSPIYAGGFVTRLLDSTKGMTFLKLLDAVCSYEDIHHAAVYHTTDQILAGLMELVRVGLVRYEIIP